MDNKEFSKQLEVSPDSYGNAIFTSIGKKLKTLSTLGTPSTLDTLSTLGTSYLIKWVVTKRL